MGLSDYKELVSAIPIMQKLKVETRDAVLAILLDLADEANLVNGDTLYEKGAKDQNTGVLLVKGSVHVDIGESDPVVVTAPDLLGEMKQFDAEGRRTATVSAAEDCVVLRFSWHDFVFRAMTEDGLSPEGQLELKDVIREFVDLRLVE